MEFARISDRARIEAFLRLDPDAHVYALADLDDFFWPETTWYGASEAQQLRAVCLLLDKLDPTVLYAVAPPDDEPMRLLLEAIRPQLPSHFFANLGVGLERVFADHDCAPEGEFLKMRLGKPCRSEPSPEVEPLGRAQLDELREFYRTRACAPGESESRFFEPYMLDFGCYFGVRRDGRLVAAGGVHAVSRRYGVAAIGNLATEPGFRREGLAREISIALCRALQPRVERIGLNVHAENRAAIACYEGLGFRAVRRYTEGRFTRSAPQARREAC